MNDKRSSILRFLVAFFAGAISMFLLLTPGNIHIKDLFSGEKLVQISPSKNVTQNAEKAGDLAFLYSRQAYRYIRDKVE